MGIKKVANNAVVWTRKHSPELLVGVNIVSSGAAIVTAVRATPAAINVINEHRENIALIHLRAKEGYKYNEQTDSDEVYTKDQVRKDLVKQYLKTGGKLVKLYGPSAICFGASAAAVISSNKIMATRNAALATSLTALRTQFSDYRKRIRDELGTEKEEDIYNNRKEVEVTKEDGTKEKIKVNGATRNPYEFWFHNGNKYWEGSVADNIVWLTGVREYFQNELTTEGFLFADKVVMHLGITEAEIGKERMRQLHFVGWKYNKNDPSDPGNKVDFGLYNDKGVLTDNAYSAKLLKADEIRIVLNCTEIFDVKKGETDYLDCHRY